MKGSANTVCGFMEDTEEHCILLCTSASSQQPLAWVHCLMVLDLHTESDNHLIRGVIAWDRDIFNGKLTSTTTVKVQWIIPGSLVMMTNIIEFYIYQPPLSPSNILYLLSSIIYATHKQIDTPKLV